MSEPDSSTGEAPIGHADWIELARLAGSEESLRAEDASTAMLDEFLAIRCEGVAYGIPIEQVREIVRMRRLTPVPRCPAWLVGIVSLRGEMVEVLDLRVRLGSVSTQPTRRSRIVVLRGSDTQVAGLLVDGVEEVHRIAESELADSPESDSAMVSAMYVHGQEFVSVLDLDRVLEVGDV